MRLPAVPGVEHRFLDVHGLRMHVAEAGEGEPLVLLHTSFQHWYAWRDVIARLAERYRGGSVHAIPSSRLGLPPDTSRTPTTCTSSCWRARVTTRTSAARR